MLKFLKRSSALAAVLWLGAAGLEAQAPASTSSTQADEKRINYVRRLSLGASLSVIVLDTMNNGTLERTTTTPPQTARYATTAQHIRVGYGGIVQILITNRFAVTGGFYMRKVAFTRDGEVYSGVDNILTAADERRYATLFEDTRAKFYDIPVTIRYFGKDRTKPGGRWFVEGGMALRKTTGIKSSVITTLGVDEPNCCNATRASNGSLRGLVAGFGGTLIDPFGIRVTPGVRYTRWMGESFNSFSTVSKRNQIEAMITIGF